MRTFRRCGVAALLLICRGGLAAAVAAHFQASDSAPCGCKPWMFSEVPSSVRLHTLPAAVTARIPMLKPYKYTTLGQRLLIVNPNDRKVVDIISPWKIVDTVRP